MHDLNAFARVSEAGQPARQPSMEELLQIFEAEREVVFKGETYLVRDNGVVLRRSRAGSRRRKLDEVWTFGTPNKSSGYLVVSRHVVHQIVTTAFHGSRPSNEHVVDHIDTNRLNNRPDNLRWVTRLENVLLNPITRRRIEIAYGSLEAFFEDPQASSVPNAEWMRTVTREQAQESLRRLLQWAEKGQGPRGGSLGDWLFERRHEGAAAAPPEHLDTPSPTQGAFQRRWRTPTEFPQCLGPVKENSISDYLSRLSFGVVFARNHYGESVVVTAGISPDGTLSVLSNTPSGVKDWALAKVYLEDGAFCHESGKTFFTLQGALKAHCQVVGEPFDESVDDFA